MKRTILLILAIVIGLLILATAMLSAAASLANGIAFATASTALLVSQCISGLLVLAALAGGIGLGFGAANFLAFRRTVQQNQFPPSEVLPALNQTQPATKHLPEPQTHLPSVYLAVKPPAQVEETEDTLFENWGW